MASKHKVGSAPYNQDVDECVAKLTAWLRDNSDNPDINVEFCTPPTLRRYATARHGDLDATKRNLLSTMAWRRTYLPPKLGCPNCDADPLSHCFFTLGIDPSRRVVVYANAAKASGQNEKHSSAQHMIHTLEHAWRNTDELELHPQWVWLVDFKGFRMWDALQGSTSNNVLGLFSEHMPERMGVVLLVNPPSVFDLLLAAIKPFMDARTLGKVHIVHCTRDNIGAKLEPFGIPPSHGISLWMKECLLLPGAPGSVPPDDLLEADVLAKIRLLPPHK